MTRSDMDLVRTYAETGSETAFSEVVSRHVSLMLQAQNKAATPDAIKEMRARMDSMTSRSAGGEFVYTQTHENIQLNKKFSEADFK